LFNPLRIESAAGIPFAPNRFVSLEIIQIEVSAFLSPFLVLNS
jgi:hypothetical protein